MPLAYRALPGLQAEDIMQLLKPLFTEYHLDTSKLLTFTADGASVNGVRRCQTNEHGKNIVALLRRHVGHRILAVHCAAHRLQLCAGDAFTAEYLKDLEKRVSSLYKFFCKHPSTKIDMAFWADVTDEPLLTSLSVGKSRWLSLLKPLQKLHGSWITVLAHLHFQWEHCTGDREQKKVIRWVFVGLCSWRAKITVSALIDILQMAFETKNVLEKDLMLDEVAEAVKVLKQRLRSYCQKASVVAEALCGNRAVARGNTFLERCMEEYEQEKGKKLCLKYSMVGDYQGEFWVPVEDLSEPEEIRTPFRTLKALSVGSARKKTFWLPKSFFPLPGIWSKINFLAPEKFFLSNPQCLLLGNLLFGNIVSHPVAFLLNCQEYSEQVAEKLTNRFGGSNLVMAYSMFRPDWAFSQDRPDSN